MVSLRFAVVYEAPADFQTATDLADRVFVDAIDWLEPEHLPYQRVWLGKAGEKPLTWSRVGDLARAVDIRARGLFDGSPALQHAKLARRTILYLRKAIPNLDAILLIRDGDNEPDRRKGLEQAREKADHPERIVIGVADLERESWVLCGFIPGNDDETARLDRLRDDLHFDPCTHSHGLTARKDHEAGSPKYVLGILCDGKQEREQRCWREAPLARLREHGAANGLRAFLDEVQDRLAPLLNDRRPIPPLTS